MNTSRLEKIIRNIYSNNVKAQEESNQLQESKQKIIDFIKK